MDHLPGVAVPAGAVSARRKASAAPARPLWVCPKCDQPFVQRNAWHSCRKVDAEAHFVDRPQARRMWEHYLEAAGRCGPVRVVANQTYLSLMVRVRFASARVRNDYLYCGLWLKRHVHCPGVVRVEQVSPRDCIHYFELFIPQDLTAEIRELLRESYAVGCQAR